MLASFVAISSLGQVLAEQEATRPVMLWDELGGRSAIVRLARGDNDKNGSLRRVETKTRRRAGQ